MASESVNLILASLCGVALAGWITFLFRLDSKFGKSNETLQAMRAFLNCAIRPRVKALAKRTRWLRTQYLSNSQRIDTHEEELASLKERVNEMIDVLQSFNKRIKRLESFFSGDKGNHTHRQ